MDRKNGLTLVEMLIVMSIIIILAVMMVAAFNSIGITNKGRDAQRKKDLKIIKIAFEEYFNDKGEFPSGVDGWNIESNCKSDIFAPYLSSWPCDPNGSPYFIPSEGVENRFRVITNLENKEDKDIPSGWYLKGDDYRLFDWTIDDVNYGVSSTNILWHDPDSLDYSECIMSGCFVFENSDCKDVTDSTGCRVGQDCYYQNSNGCVPQCKVSCCAAGCN